ncbi:MAG: NAD(P)-dependent oxidoreductase, partial [Hyphomicrobium sp.]
MSGKAALIGATGFVGSYLRDTGGYTHFYNSTNIAEIQHEHFDVIVCAGTSAVKWRANAEPEQDRAGIRKLMAALATVKADQFFLISTVDVFLHPHAVDE